MLSSSVIVDSTVCTSSAVKCGKYMLARLTTILFVEDFKDVGADERIVSACSRMLSIATSLSTEASATLPPCTSVLLVAADNRNFFGLIIDADDDVVPVGFDTIVELLHSLDLTQFKTPWLIL